jgi:hypothetical protein
LWQIEEVFKINNGKLIINKKKDRTPYKWEYETPSNRIIGVKGEWNIKISIIARNSNDVWYFLSEDHCEEKWVTSRFKFAVSPHADLNVDLKKIGLGTVWIHDKSKKTWTDIKYDWFPEKNEKTPDFLNML